jgi:hypothetical protein
MVRTVPRSEPKQDLTSFQFIISCLECLTGLIQRYGGTVTIPGIEYANSWIPADTQDLYDVIGRHWVENNLRNGRQTRNGVDHYDQDVGGSPVPSKSLDTKVGDSESVVQEAIEVTDIYVLPKTLGAQYNDPTPSTTSSHTTATSCSRRAFAKVGLPNGTEVTVGSLIRLLDRATQHRATPKDGQSYYFFRGYEGMELWSMLFFEDNNEAAVVAFGRMLIARGIIHNYTPKCENFAQTFLVLQPLQEPRVLNTFVKWPNSHIESREEDPMDVILRLSRHMDELCSQDGNRPNLSLFHDFEEAVAQLQVIGLPKTPVEKVTFAINLFNLIMRHAMLAAENRGWVWPQRLDELEAFLSKIGYNIGGDWISLADLQSSLYGRSGDPAPVLLAKKQKWWHQLSCHGGMEKDLHYASPVFRSDPRILMATTWGTQSSPNVSTLYPNRLEEGLEAAAEIYCQQHVVVGFDRVVLPALLAWHRADFGNDPEDVMNSLYPYLSFLQLKQLQDLHEMGRVRVVFDEDFCWKRGMPSKDSRAVTPHLAAVALHRPPGKPQRSAGGGSVSKVRNWLTRRPSCGEEQMFAPSRGDLTTHPPPYEATDDVNYSTEDDNDDDDDDGHSFFQSVMSEITYGSEFEDLVPSSSRASRLQRLQRLSL